jgi:predicted nuclease of predicted toxin-antitoxin system
MSLRFFSDHCVSNFIINSLRNSGNEVFILKDHIPVDSPDSLVLRQAQKLDSILISLNGDFSDILTYPPQRYKGIIALQIRNHPEVIPHLMERLVKFLSAHPRMEDYRGKLILVEVHRIRIYQ